MCGILFCSVFFLGCGRQRTTSYDDTKTQLFVYNYNGGVGSEWLTNIKLAFEEKFKDYKLGDKVGVEVVIDPNKVKGSTLLGNVEGSVNEIFITEETNYYDVVNQGLALDLTDTLNETGSDGKTILSKFTDVQADYYKANDKYYAVPHSYMPYGIIYNEEIFEQKKLYFSKNGAPSERLQDGGSFTGYKYNDGSDRENLSAGPDGEYGTYDDGLPATYEEFYVLMDKMVEVGVTPLVYTGQYESAYINWLAGRLAMDYEGEDNLKTIISRSGTLTDSFVESVSSDGTPNIIETYTVGANKEKAIYHTAGFYYALTFIEKMYSSSSYSATRRPGNSAITHTVAQQEFLISAQSSYKDLPIAMLVEGCWWENESVLYGNFEKIESEGGQSHSDFRLRFMALPNATEDKIGSNPVSAECINSFMFISSSIASEKTDLAKEFIKFINSDEMLVSFHTDTNVFRALEYDLSQKDYNILSYFGKSVYDYVIANGKYYPYSSSEAFLNNPDRISQMFVTSKYINVTSLKTEGVTAIDYFNGMKALNALS